MAITHAVYGAFMQNLLTGLHNVHTDTMNAALLTSAYTPSLDNHAVLTDVNASEVVGTGYTAGGQPVVVTATNYSSGSLSVAANSVTWSTLTASIRYAVIYQVKSTAATSNLMGLIDFGAVRTYNAAPFTLSAPNGVLVLGRAS